jgi:tripartite-type tricarboxylate transporter receptor subunit TctC
MRPAALILLGSLMIPIVGYAQTPAPGAFPSRPIRIIVPFSAGSASDFLARQIAQKMTENWGQQVVVDNRPSAAGTVAGEIVARATPDGYTLMVTSSAIAGSAALYPKLPYDTAKDFAPISMIAVAPTMFVTAPNSGIKSIKDLIAIAQKKPGQLTYAHSGIGSGTHYASELFNAIAGIKTIHVPYKGSPEALTDAATQRVSYGVVPMAPAVPLVKAGRVHAIAVTTATRSHTLPDVPTVAESGLPAYRYDGWFGVFAPGKLPPQLVKQLSGEVARILDLPDVRERILNLATTPKSSSPEDLHKLLRSEIETRRKIFKDLAAQPQ